LGRGGSGARQRRAFSPEKRLPLPEKKQKAGCETPKPQGQIFSVGVFWSLSPKLRNMRGTLWARSYLFWSPSFATPSKAAFGAAHRGFDWQAGLGRGLPAAVRSISPVLASGGIHAGETGGASDNPRRRRVRGSPRFAFPGPRRTVRLLSDPLRKLNNANQASISRPETCGILAQQL